MQNIVICPIEHQDIPAVVDIQINGWKTAYKEIIADDFLASMNREERIAEREKDFSEKILSSLRQEMNWSGLVDIQIILIKSEDFLVSIVNCVHYM